MNAPTAFVCAMPMELSPLVRALGLTKSTVGDVEVRAGAILTTPVIAIVTGMGTALAAAATERLLDAVDVERVISVGITGGVDSTPIGTVVLPEVVVDAATGEEHAPAPIGLGSPKGSMWTSDDFTTDHEVIDDLRAKGVVALDMETAAIAAVCERRGVPWSVVRAISDRPSDGMVGEDTFKLSNQDGTPNVAAVAKWMVGHPGRLPQMVRLARDARTATRAAADAAIEAVRGLTASGV